VERSDRVVPLAAALAGVILTARTSLLGTARAAAAGGSPVGLARGLSGPNAGGGRGRRDRRAAELRGAAAVPTRGRRLGGPTGLLGVDSVGAAGRKGGFATRAALSSPSGPSRVSGPTGLFLQSGVSGGCAEQIADLIRPKPDWVWG